MASAPQGEVGAAVASLGVVVARGQSKRLPRKMLRPLAGHPLVAYMARAALASGLDRVILSTDDDEIAAAAKSYGLEAPFRRPAELATDFATNDRVLLHALDWAESHFSAQRQTFQSRFRPALAGLALAARGGSLDDASSDRSARRFLGWASGEHCLLGP